MLARAAERRCRDVSVYTRWANYCLSKRGIVVKDLTKDFRNGVNLIHLYEILSGEKLSGSFEYPKGYLQSVCNFSIVLKPINNFIEKSGTGTKFSPNSLVLGNKRMILQIFWTLISMFIGGDVGNFSSLRKFLLKWVKQVTAEYENVKITNFSKSFKDGLAFNAILDHHVNGLIDFSTLSKHRPLENLRNAFDKAETIGIPALLTVDDLSQPVPTERSIIAYISTLYKFFHDRNLKRDEEEIVCWLGDPDNLEHVSIPSVSIQFSQFSELERIGVAKLFLGIARDPELNCRKSVVGSPEVWERESVPKRRRRRIKEKRMVEWKRMECEETMEESRRQVGRLEEKLCILESMGFQNKELCESLLSECGGSVQELVNRMYE